MDNEFYRAHDYNPKTLKDGKAPTGANNFFEADYEPSFPNIENPFIATDFFYESLVEGTVSVIGRIPYPEAFQQFSFVIPCSTEDGTYQITEADTGISAAFITGYVGIIRLVKGTIKFSRDKVRNTIDASFSVYIPHKHEEEETEEYHAEGRIFLNATGPLCVEG